MPAPTADDAIALTRAWLRHAVIGLNLCPFAKAVEAKDLVRYVVADGDDPEALLALLADELRRLAAADPAEIETTLIILPRALADFLDFNDFLDPAEGVLEALGLDGVLQIASFHPAYRFAGTDPDDVANASNRSPFPTLHLLREESIDRAVAAFPEAEAIYEANIRTLEALGPKGWSALQARIAAQAAQRS